MQSTQALLVGDCPEFLAQHSSAYHCLNAAPTGFYLAQTAQGIWALHHAQHKPIHIDFSSAHYRHRGGTEYLPKAFKGMTGGKIIDATAGWARDAWLLAYRGFHLSLYERNPYLYALLKQGIEQAQRNPLTAEVAKRLTLTYADSRTMLLSAEVQCDAIYLDPMYPMRQKSAKVKKEMQILHSLLGADSGEREDNSALLNSALACTCQRVVVKRPAHAPYLGNLTPHHSLEAPNTRFDIYLRTRAV